MLSRVPRPSYAWAVFFVRDDETHAGGIEPLVGAYILLPVGMGMSELNMSHWIFHVPFDFFDTFIHLPWSIWDPSAPVISYVPVP